MKHIGFLIPALAATVVAATLTTTSAYALESLGNFKDWSAHADGKGKTRVCWIYSEPKSSEGHYTRRGRIYALVTNRPDDGVTSQVQFTAGYIFKKDSVVHVTIGNKSFQLFTNKDTAWARNKDEDHAIVAAMRGGSRMIVKGVSSRGTRTTDVYSLAGVTAADNAIDKACGGK